MIGDDPGALKPDESRQIQVGVPDAEEAES